VPGRHAALNFKSQIANLKLKKARDLIGYVDLKFSHGLTQSNTDFLASFALFVFTLPKSILKILLILSKKPTATISRISYYPFNLRHLRLMKPSPMMMQATV
jgi:hypothetical protein